MLLPAAGVNATRPLTSLNDVTSGRLPPPAVATGTFSVTLTAAVPPAGTVTLEGTDTVCGLPCSSVSATLNVAAELPRFVSVIVPVWLKSALSSLKPKLNDGVCFVPSATTFVFVAFCACTRPSCA